MRSDCFAYQIIEKRGEERERCFCTTNEKCEGCDFYKPKESLTKHVFYIHQTMIVEWIPK